MNTTNLSCSPKHAYKTMKNVIQCRWLSEGKGAFIYPFMKCVPYPLTMYGIEYVKFEDGDK